MERAVGLGDCPVGLVLLEPCLGIKLVEALRFEAGRSCTVEFGLGGGDGPSASARAQPWRP
jgi:hypothetical protein